jgi:hypothetical protein
MRTKYDGANQLELSFYNVDGKPMTVKDGFSTKRSTYDSLDNLTSVEFFDAAGKPVKVSAGYAAERFRYDDRNNEIEDAWYGANGELAMQSDGYAIVHMQYDARNNPSEISYLDRDRKPVVSVTGFASVRLQNDGADRLTSETYFDETGNPQCRNAGYTRFCKVEHGYDAAGREVETRYVDADGHVAVTGSFSLDAQGSPAGARYVGEHGEALDFREVVSYVSPGGQAEKLLKKGDLILRYADNPVDGPRSMIRLVNEPFGDTRKVDILRDGKPMTLTVKPGALGYISQVSFVQRK